MINEARPGRFAPYALALLRSIAALLFLAHGTRKFLGFPAGRAAWTGWSLASPGALPA